MQWEPLIVSEKDGELFLQQTLALPRINSLLRLEGGALPSHIQVLVLASFANCKWRQNWMSCWILPQHDWWWLYPLVCSHILQNTVIKMSLILLYFPKFWPFDHVYGERVYTDVKVKVLEEKERRDQCKRYSKGRNVGLTIQLGWEAGNQYSI